MEGASSSAAGSMWAVAPVEEVVSVIRKEKENHRSSYVEESVGGGTCAICLDEIVLGERALVKGCEHAYCVTCILRWASYKGENVNCPRCKLPFQFLSVHRTLDGCIRDFMFEESIWLLLRAQWFVPLSVPAEGQEAPEDDFSSLQYDHYDSIEGEVEDSLEEDYCVAARSFPLLIGNRSWGPNGYIEAGRKEARSVNWRCSGSGNPLSEAASSGWSSSSSHKSKAALRGGAGAIMGRRARRTMKRESAANHEQHLEWSSRVSAADSGPPNP